MINQSKQPKPYPHDFVAGSAVFAMHLLKVLQDGGLQDRTRRTQVGKR